MKLRTGKPEEAGMSTKKVQHIVGLAKGWVDQGVTPALVILVARKGIIVIHEAFGRLTPEPDSPPLQPDSIYPVASISKPMTATAIMLLVEDGLLGLNRPVSWYIPEFKGEGKEAVMVHHLLTHTSGLNQEAIDEYIKRTRGTIEIPPPDSTEHPEHHDTMFLVYGAPLWKSPGMEMSYCNYGYCLLGEIVRRISGKSFDSFTREKIFKPLGMKDTAFVVTDFMRDRIVKRPADAPDASWLNSSWLQEIPHPAGGAFSTAMDTAIFGQMFLNRGIYGDIRILSKTSVFEMTRNQIPGIGSRHGSEFFPEASWGFGWNIPGYKKYLGAGTLNSKETFDHSGAGGVVLWIDPVYEVVGVYLGVRINPGSNREIAGYWELVMNMITAAIAE